MPLSPKSPRLFVLCVLALALGLRLVHFTRVDLWQDEANEVFICEGTWAETLSRVRASEMRPPVRYFFLKLWLLGGRGTSYLRLPSLAFSVLAVALLYLVARRRFEEEPARIATMLMACASFAISSAHFCRSYSLDLFVTLLAVHAFHRYEDRGSRSDRAYAIAAITLAAYTSYFFHFVLLVMALFRLNSVRRAKSRWNEFLRLFVPVGVLAIPLLFLALEQLGNARANRWHAGGLELRQFLGYFRVLAAGRIKNWDFSRLQDFATLLCVVLAGTGCWRIVKGDRDTVGDARKGWFAPAWFLIPVCLISLFSLASIGLFTVRTMIVFMPAYYLLIAAGIRGIDSRPGRALAVLLLCGINLYSFYTSGDLRYLTNGSRKASAALAEVTEPDELIVHASHFTYFPMRFYAPRLSHRILHERVPWNWGASQVPLEHLWPDLVPARNKGGFWLVRKHNHYEEDYQHWRSQIAELASPWESGPTGVTRAFVADDRLPMGNLILTHYSVQTIDEPIPPAKNRIRQELESLRQSYLDWYHYEDQWTKLALDPLTVRGNMPDSSQEQPDDARTAP